MGAGPHDVESRPRARRRQRLGRRSLGRSLIALLLLGILLPACLSPTLPLPPPSRPKVTAPDEEGRIQISGRINAHSLVLAQNARTNDIVGKETGSSGEYTLEMAAEVNDVIEVWEVYKTEQSERVLVVVPEHDASLGASGSPGE